MPNVSNMVRLGDIAQVVSQANGLPELRAAMLLLINRIDAQNNNLVDQIKGIVTVFPFDPADYPEKVEGAKPGDVAIFKKYGGVDIKVY